MPNEKKLVPIDDLPEDVKNIVPTDDLPDDLKKKVSTEPVTTTPSVSESGVPSTSQTETPQYQWISTTTPKQIISQQTSKVEEEPITTPITKKVPEKSIKDLENIAYRASENKLYGNSIKTAEDIIAKDPNNYYAYQLKAHNLTKLGHYDQAIENTTIALTINPDEPQLYQDLAQNYYLKGDKYNAKLAVNKYIDIIEKQPDVDEYTAQQLRNAYSIKANLSKESGNEIQYKKDVDNLMSANAIYETKKEERYKQQDIQTLKGLPDYLMTSPISPISYLTGGIVAAGEGYKKIADTKEVYEKEGAAAATVNALAGAMEMGMGLGSYVPAGSGLSKALQTAKVSKYIATPINFFAPELAEFNLVLKGTEMILPSQITNFVTRPITTVLNDAEEKISKYSTIKKEMLNMADMVGFMTMLHAGKTLATKNIEANEASKLRKEASIIQNKMLYNKPLTPEEARKVMNAVNTATVEDVLTANEVIKQYKEKPESKKTALENINDKEKQIRELTSPAKKEISTDDTVEASKIQEDLSKIKNATNKRISEETKPIQQNIDRLNRELETNLKQQEEAEKGEGHETINENDDGTVLYQYQHPSGAMFEGGRFTTLEEARAQRDFYFAKRGVELPKKYDIELLKAEENRINNEIEGERDRRSFIINKIYNKPLREYLPYEPELPTIEEKMPIEPTPETPVNIESKPKMEETVYDKENIEGLPSEIGKGEEPIPAEPVKETGGEKAEVGGILQTQKGEVTEPMVEGAEVKPPSKPLKDVESTKKAMSKLEEDNPDLYEEIKNKNTLDNYDIKKTVIPNNIESEMFWQEKLIEKALKDAGVDFSKQGSKTSGTTYYHLHLNNGDSFKLRVSEHAKKYSSDGNIEYNKNTTPDEILEKLTNELPDNKILKNTSIADEYYKQKSYKNITNLELVKAVEKILGKIKEEAKVPAITQPEAKPTAKPTKQYRQPASIREEIYQFFARGGKFNDEQFTALTGKDARKEGYQWAVSKEGVKSESFFENIENEDIKKNVEAMDIENDIVDVISKYASKDELIKNYEKTYNPYEIDITAEKQTKKGKLPKNIEGVPFSIGEYAEGEPIEHSTKVEINPIETPELLRFAEELQTEVIPGGVSGEVKGRFSAGKIKLNKELFKKENLIQLAKTLAHEIGHLADWMPDKTMAKGNIIGRIHSLNEFVKVAFSNKKEIGYTSKELSDIRKSIKTDYLKTLPLRLSQAYETGKGITKKERIDIKKSIDRQYKDFIKDEKIEVNKEYKEELQKFSEEWRPYDKAEATEKFVRYRNSAKELYADAISGLLINPAYFESKCPKFTKAFFDNINKKPEVRDAYFGVQELIKDPITLQQERLNLKYEGYEKAKQAAIKATEERQELKLKNKLTLQEFFLKSLISDAYPALFKFSKKTAQDSGKILSERQKIRNLREQYMFGQNAEYKFVNEILNEIDLPLESIGISRDTMGALMEAERNIADRLEKANPGAMQGEKVNKEMIDYINSQFTPEQATVVKQLIQNFHDKVYDVFTKAYEAGCFTKEQFDTITKWKDSYATYVPIRYAGKWLAAGFKEMTGSLEQIKNPYISTVQKTLAVIRLINKQKLTTSFLDNLKTVEPENVFDLKTIHDKDGRFIKFEEKEGYATIPYYKEGKYSAMAIDGKCKDFFIKFSELPQQYATIFNALKFQQLTEAFKMKVTTLNPSFLFYANPIIDNFRSAANIATILNADKGLATKIYNNTKVSGYMLGMYLPTFIKVLLKSGKFKKGEFPPIVQEMLDKGVLKYEHITGGQYDFSTNEFIDQIYVDKAINRKESFIGKALQSNNVFYKSMGKLFEGARQLLKAGELSSKINGYTILKNNLKNAEAAGFYTRNYVGTPNFSERGSITKYTNTIFPFSNVILQGLRTDSELAFGSKTAGSYWFYQLGATAIPAMMTSAAAAGLFGDDLKRMFGKIPEYALKNYLCIPLGEDEISGKTRFMQVPMPHFNKFGYNAIRLGFEKAVNDMPKSDMDAIKSIATISSDMTPSISPFITVISAIFDYHTGGNPQDYFYNSDVVREETIKRYGRYSTEAEKQIGYWSLRKIGLSEVADLLHRDKMNQTNVEYVMKNFPIISRMIKTSDKGITEKTTALTQYFNENILSEQYKAKEEFKDYILKQVEKTGNSIEAYRGEIKKALTTPEQKKDKRNEIINDFIKKVNKLTVLNKNNPYTPIAKGLIFKTNEEKAFVLQSLIKELYPDKKQEIFEYLITNDIISNDFEKNYYDKIK